MNERRPSVLGSAKPRVGPKTRVTVLDAAPAKGAALPADATLAVATAAPTTAVTLFTGSKIIIHESQLQAAEQALAQLDFATISARDIVQLSSEAEQALNTTLDGFVSRLGKDVAAPVFELVNRLQNGVKEADLPKLVQEIQTVKPGWIDSVLGKIQRKSPGELMAAALSRLKTVFKLKVDNLKDEVIGKLEAEFGNKTKSVIEELDQLGLLKTSYGDHRDDFARAAAVTEAFLQKAEAYVETRTQELANDNSPQARDELEELNTKLIFLRSRALALEGVYSGLPGNQEVIRQIEVAGVSTLGEVITTSGSRFASIKMKLLAIHGALAVRDYQNLSEATAELDRNLTAVQGQVVKDAAVNAALAPGRNRLAQAEQVQKLVQDAAELYAAVKTAREESNQNFKAAKKGFESAREAMDQLAQHRPTGALQLK